MKKYLSMFFLACVLFLTACGGDDGYTLRVWSFTDEALTFITEFERQNPDQRVQFQMQGMDGGAYQDWVLTALATGQNVPDIIFLEAQFLRQFVESPFLANLNDLLPAAQRAGTYQFTIDAATHEGEVRAFSHQATPGVMYYRRSIALEVFGYDDPERIQQHFRDIPTTMASARRIHEATNGRVFTVASPWEFYAGFYANRTSPWIVDNRFVFDPIMHDMLDLSMYLRENDFEARAGAWSESWFAGMSDTLVDAAGNDRQIFSYMLPTWGLTFVIMNNYSTATTSTHGDWGIIPGPLPYQAGGTWMAVTRDAENAEAARAFIEFATLNEETLTNWATGVFTNEYLRGINPELPLTQAQGPGDFVSSNNVVQRIAASFATGPAADFIGGQNPYTAFQLVAPNISLRFMQGTDAIIQNAFQDALNLYNDGAMSRQEALEQFGNSILIDIPDLNISW
jgi:ABC-type glycerol-3-phosphate transport system substrate-binding protein